MRAASFIPTIVAPCVVLKRHQNGLQHNITVMRGCIWMVLSCCMQADASTAAAAPVQPAAAVSVAAAPAAAAAPPVASGSEALPEGWAEAIDPTYNHPYWYNVSTGERSWVRPKPAAAASAPANAAPAVQQASLLRPSYLC